MFDPTPIRSALAAVPAGRWVVGVSGGADSVALLLALRAHRPDVEPIVAHLDHQTRAAESDADAAFVAEIADQLGVARVIERIEALAPIAEANAEARFRRARHALFARVVAERSAAGALLAHHADDRAETTLLRLLRGGEATALDGLRSPATVAGLTIIRPLLSLRRKTLEAFLRAADQPWRVDASNADARFARNRVRAFLAKRPTLTPRLLALADAADAWAAYVARSAPTLDASFACAALADLPAPLARAAARRWLRDRGADEGELSIAVVERLIAMATDRSTAATRTFPGSVVVRREGDRIHVPPPLPRSRGRGLG